MAAAIQEILDTLIASEKANDAHQMAGVLAEDFRFAGVFTREGDGWKLLHAQLSPMIGR